MLSCRTLPNLAGKLRVFFVALAFLLVATGVVQTPSRAATFSVSVSTLAGNGERGFVDGPAKIATFSGPSAVAIDKFGTLYVADTGNNAIRKVDTQGNVTTLAGDGSRGFTDGSPREANFNAPSALSIDGGGNVFVADTGNYAIRKITPEGIVTTLAGTGKSGSTNGPGGRNETATFAKLKALTVDGDNNVFVADDLSLRKIDKNAKVTAYGSRLPISLTSGLAADRDGSLYVSSPYSGVVKVSSNEKLTVLMSSSKDRPFMGPGPLNIAREANGTILLSDSGRNTIEQVDPSGTLTLLVGPNQRAVDGAATPGFTNGSGGPTGPATMNRPGGIAVDSDGTIFVADTANNSIRKIAGSRSIATPPPTIATAATPPTAASPTPPIEGPKTRITTIDQVNKAYGVVANTRGDAYVSDESSVKLFARGTAQSYVLGQSSKTFDPTHETQDANFLPTGLAVDNAAGNVYVADLGHAKIWVLDQDNGVTTLAGSGKFGFADGTGGSEGTATFRDPWGIAVDGNGNVYVADSANHAIRKIDQSMNVTTLAGTGKRGFDNGPGGRTGAATFNQPSGVAVDRATGDVFVVDTGNNSIRKIDANGAVSTLALHNPDGSTVSGNNGGLNGPLGLTIDAKGVMFVADTANLAIRRIERDGTITTPIQWPDVSSPVTPAAIAVDATGILFVTTLGKSNAQLLRIDLTIPEALAVTASTTPPNAKKTPTKKQVKKARIVSKKPAKK
jgi:trimeric autotransporter adhesin